MPEAVVGWVRSLFGTLGGIWGGKLYILGVAGYNTPIWDVLALQGEQEEAGERLYGAKFENYVPIRQAVPVDLARARVCSWARWARFFMEKKRYYRKHNTFISILPFLSSQGREEWMDGVE